MKQTPLKRRAWMRSRADSYSRRIKGLDPEREAWKTPRYGRCQLCRLLDDFPLHGAHVLDRQMLERLGLPQYDPRNRMDLCSRCHLSSHYGLENRKIPVEKIPECAIAFMVEVLTEDGAIDYLERHYACEVSW